MMTTAALRLHNIHSEYISYLQHIHSGFLEGESSEFSNSKILWGLVEINTAVSGLSVAFLHGGPSNKYYTSAVAWIHNCFTVLTFRTCTDAASNTLSSQDLQIAQLSCVTSLR